MFPSMLRILRDALSTLTPFRIVILLTALCAAGCGSDKSDVPAPTTASPASMTGIRLSESAITLAAGETRTLRARLSYSNDTIAEATNEAVWSSSAPAVATVARGAVVAHAPGQAVITARFNSFESTTTVSVSAPPVTLVSIAVTPPSPSLSTGNTQQFTATGTFSDATTEDLTTQVTWASSNSSAATIDSQGLSTAVAAGSTQITATLSGVASPAAMLTAVDPMTMLSASVATLSLSVSDPALNPALTGSARLVMVTNVGTYVAQGITVDVSALPSGTSITSATCNGALAPGASCQIEITPGSVPSAAPGDPAPSPATLTIEGTNTNTIPVQVSVLTYGSVSQGGYVFSIDDTTPISASIGGTVAALSDQAISVPWSTTFDAIYGISEISTPSSPNPSSGQLSGMVACNGHTDGACNTTNIEIQYVSSSPSDYAAGACTSVVSGYSDWYLPAVCQLGYDGASVGTGCGVVSNPLIQNMQSNLIDNGGLGNLTGIYWSSTQYSAVPMALAFAQAFGNSIQTSKATAIDVRCARDLTF